MSRTPAQVARLYNLLPPERRLAVVRDLPPGSLAVLHAGLAELDAEEPDRD
jgi:hypothetical protein